MRENNIRNIWSKGETALTGWLAIPSSLSAELMARQGWDAVCIDLQHGAIGYQTALTMLQAISTTDATPLVRVPDNDAATIGKLLDAGAYGIICPMINTRAQAEAFVRACRYPPNGHRSVGPLRASLYGGADYVKHANTTILTMAMIETAEAVSNLDDILGTPGLDSIYVGPSDLAVSMGESAGFDPAYPGVMKAIEMIAAAATQRGIVPGIHVGSVAYGNRMRGLGYRFMAYLSDFRFLQNAVSRGLAAMRSGTPEAGIP
ncbi:aldolase/citrate lyase family protein [soil metagenome]